MEDYLNRCAGSILGYVKAENKSKHSLKKRNQRNGTDVQKE